MLYIPFIDQTFQQSETQTCPHVKHVKNWHKTHSKLRNMIVAEISPQARISNEPVLKDSNSSSLETRTTPQFGFLCAKKLQKS